MGQNHDYYFLALICIVSMTEAANVLLSNNFSLSGNQHLHSSDYRFVMQTDCNLVLFDGARAVVSSNTSGRGADCSLRMGLDGDLAIYDRNASISVWESKTPFAPDSFFALTSNGSLVIYNFVNVTPIALTAAEDLANFTTGPRLAWKTSTPVDGSPYMPVGYFMDEGCSLQPVAGAFDLTLQYDCNLQSVELLANGSTRTMSFGPGHQCRLVLPPDGNVQLQTVGSENLVWASNVSGNASVNWAAMVYRFTGDVMVRDLLNPGTVLWTTANIRKAVGGKKKKQVSITVKYVIGVVAAAFVLAIVAGSSIVYYLWSGAGIAEAEKELQRRLGTKKRKCITFSPAAIKQATRNFERKIGHGGFGDVFYGMLPCGQEIAVKVLSAKSHQSKEEFYNELDLHNKCSPAIIHRDIKTINILLTETLVAKVADFGLSKLRSTDQAVASHVTTLVKGTPGYLDPEYHESGMLTEKSDVYAFGIVLMEILTGQHHFCLTEKVLEAWTSKQLEDLADPFLTSDYDRDEFQKLVQLALSCACKKGRERPSMASIVHELQEINHVYISETTQCKHGELMAFTSISSEPGAVA